MLYSVVFYMCYETLVYLCLFNYSLYTSCTWSTESKENELGRKVHSTDSHTL